MYVATPLFRGVQQHASLYTSAYVITNAKVVTEREKTAETTMTAPRSLPDTKRVAIDYDRLYECKYKVFNSPVGKQLTQSAPHSQKTAPADGSREMFEYLGTVVIEDTNRAGFVWEVHPDLAPPPSTYMFSGLQMKTNQPTCVNADWNRNTALRPWQSGPQEALHVIGITARWSPGARGRKQSAVCGLRSPSAVCLLVPNTS